MLYALMRKFLPSLLSFVLALSLPVSSGAGDVPAEDDRQRVSGIITINDQRRIAVIEQPDGAFVMVTAGDTIGNDKVEEIADHWLRIREADGGERRLWVAGFRAATGGSETDSALVVEREDAGIAYNRTLAREGSIRELDRLSAAESSPEEDISTLLGPMIDLPGDAHIVAIDHEPVGSVRDGMTRIRDALAAGSVVRLSIEGIHGKEGVYLMPEPAAAQ